MPVYPRVCGGTSDMKLAIPVFAGLSPRVRGNLGTPSCLLALLRSIPACAGEPPCGCTVAGYCAVYPRVCGGTSIMRITSPRKSGLSPRVRGNPFVRYLRQYHSGSIPACAGEPFVRHTKIPCEWVYPRVCGGTDSCGPYVLGLDGLSPRVRGNLFGQFGASVNGRSIPACAGEPHHLLGRRDERMVYPRVCGGTCL